MTLTAALVTFVMLVAAIVSSAVVTAEHKHRQWIRTLRRLEAAKKAQREEHEAVKKSDGLRPQ